MNARSRPGVRVRGWGVNHDPTKQHQGTSCVPMAAGAETAAAAASFSSFSSSLDSTAPAVSVALAAALSPAPAPAATAALGVGWVTVDAVSVTAGEGRKVTDRVCPRTPRVFLADWNANRGRSPVEDTVLYSRPARALCQAQKGRVIGATSQGWGVSTELFGVQRWWCLHCTQTVPYGAPDPRKFTRAQGTP
jgi:hypothetical protein